MMESAAGKGADRSGRKESWGAILRARLVRAVVLWPRAVMRGRRGEEDAADADPGVEEREAATVSSRAAGRKSARMSMAGCWRAAAERRGRGN